MRARLLLCFSTLACLLILSACRKDVHFAVNERDAMSAGLLESAKSWHSQNLDPAKKEGRLTPLWEDAWRLKSGLLIVPAPEFPNYNPKLTIRRFFAFTSRNESVVDGRIIEFLGNDYDVNANLDLLVSHIDEDYIKGFNGSIIRYDINYRPLSNATFAKGKRLHNVFTSMVTMSGEELLRIQKEGVNTVPIPPKE